jgi:hypothetical protein
MTDARAVPPSPPRRVLAPVVWAIGLGLFYGLLGRLVFGHHVDSDSPLATAFAPMSVAFLFGVPLGLGFLCVWAGEREAPWRWYQWILMPWVPGFAALGAALLLAWEGVICIFLWIPLVMILSSLGGVVAGLWRRWRRRRAPPAALAAALLLPFAFAPIENRFTAPSEVREVRTDVDIAADADTVWNEIVAVRPIARSEQRFHLVHLLGFPHPIEARTLGTGVGSVRHATFDGGVLFVETVQRYEPARRLAFTIAADPHSIPRQTLDEHVTVGGPYFDVLTGDYSIEPLAQGHVRLHLVSRHRLSTHFNFYAGAWTSFILRDVQNNILDVVRARAEAAARTAPQGGHPR